jgi:hypothetical protein
VPGPAQVLGKLAQGFQDLRKHRANGESTDCAHAPNLPADVASIWLFCQWSGPRGVVMMGRVGSNPDKTDLELTP